MAVEDRAVPELSIPLGAIRRWTEVTVRPDVTRASQRFEDEFGEYLRGNPRNISVPQHGREGKYVVLPFASHPQIAEVGVEVLICWDLWNNRGEIGLKGEPDSCPDR